MARPRKYPPELLDCGARLVLESARPIAHVAKDLGVPPETLRRWLRQVRADEGLRPDLPTAAEREEIKQLPRRSTSCAGPTRSSRPPRYFRDRARPRPKEVSAFIDEHRERFGVGPVCGTLGVSASAYYQRATGERCQRAVEDQQLVEVIRATDAANYYAYGYRRGA